MKAWLIYDEAGAKRNKDYIALHQELAGEFHIQLEFLLDTQVRDRLVTEKELPDFCFVRTINPELSKCLERKSIKVFNPSFVSEICNDKGKTITYIQENSRVPLIPTKRFANHQLSRELLQEYPNSVVKAVDGHGGKEVFLSSAPYHEIEKGIQNSDFIIQPFIQQAKRDVRVYVIGKRIMGAVERRAREGFKSNFSLGGEISPYRLSLEEKKLVYEVCNLFSFGMVGIDFLVEKEGQWLLNEIEDVVGARMYYQCYPDSNLLRDYFLYVSEQMRK